MNPPMRMLILLAVFWAAGSLLLAAESPSTPQPAAADKTITSEPQNPDKSADKKTEGDAKTDAAKTDAAKTDAKGDAKTDTKKADKRSIADQAEAALKAAAEADPGSASREPPKSDEQGAKNDTEVQPSGGAAKGPSPQRFMPTEQVRADFDVSFPIDI